MKTLDAVNAIITNELVKITTANGYHTNPTILSGWLTMYVDDLVANNGFPALSVQYSRDKYNKNNGTGHTITERTLEVSGAVEVNDPAQVNLKLEELLDDVKNCIGANNKLTIDNTVFILPEGESRYVGFSMTVVIKINETWEQPQL